MVWFSIQSLIVIVLAFLLGLVVGWLWWRRRKVRFSESNAVTAVTKRHEAALADSRTALTRARADVEAKDAEIARLTALVPAGTDAGTRDGADDGTDDAAPGPDAPTALAATPDDAGPDPRDAEIARLRELVEQAEATAAAHRDQIAGRDTRLAELDAVLAEREAELARRAAAPSGAGTAVPVAAPSADAGGIATHPGGIATDATPVESIDGVTLEPTEPATAAFAGLAEPSGQDVATASPGTGPIDLLDGAGTTAPASHEADLSAAPDVATPDVATPDVATPDVATPDVATPEASAAVDETPTVVDVTDAGAPPAASAPDEPHALVDVAAAEATPEAPVVHDDLERVEGIGPRIGAALRQAGILSFRQLADADTPTLQAALEKAGLRFAPSLPTWSRQAALLADGDEAGFVSLTERLVAGRDISGTK